MTLKQKFISLKDDPEGLKDFLANLTPEEYEELSTEIKKDASSVLLLKMIAKEFISTNGAITSFGVGTLGGLIALVAGAGLGKAALTTIGLGAVVKLFLGGLATDPDAELFRRIGRYFASWFRSEE